MFVDWQVLVHRLPLAKHESALNIAFLLLTLAISRPAESADEVRLGSRLSLDIIREVISIIAREDLATRGRRVGALGPQLLDTDVVVGVDDGRNVKVGKTVPALEGHLAEHTGDARGAVGNGVPVADPALRELGRYGGVALDVDVGKGRVAGIGGEDDGAVGAVLGDEGDGVGGDGDGRGEHAEDDAGELHFDGTLGLWGSCLFYGSSYI